MTSPSPWIGRPTPSPWAQALISRPVRCTGATRTMSFLLTLQKPSQTNILTSDLCIPKRARTPHHSHIYDFYITLISCGRQCFAIGMSLPQWSFLLIYLARYRFYTDTTATTRRTSQKPAEEFYAAFRNKYPNVGPGTIRTSTASTTQSTTQLSGPLSDPIMDHRCGRFFCFHPFGFLGAFHAVSIPHHYHGDSGRSILRIRAHLFHY